MWPAMEKPTTRAKIQLCGRGLNTQVREIFLILFFFWYSESILHLSIKFQRDTSLFSAWIAREKEWRSVLASYVNGLAVLSINQNLQTAIDHHDNTRAWWAQSSSAITQQWQRVAEALDNLRDCHSSKRSLFHSEVNQQDSPTHQPHPSITDTLS